MKETIKKKPVKPDPATSSMSEKGNDLGLIKIHENVISTIVRKATLETEGVSRLAGSSFVDNIAEIVGSRKMSDRSIAINLEDDKVDIEVKVNILFGFRVPDVAAAIQSAIIEEVENTTGMSVTSVNVVIQEIEEQHLPAAKEAKPAETDDEA
jgi:uncharacterized alkaline shock family protein YloU